MNTEILMNRINMKVVLQERDEVISNIELFNIANVDIPKDYSNKLRDLNKTIEDMKEKYPEFFV